MNKMPVVNEQERERIRRGLVNYRRAHNIGAPELQQRMLYQLYKGERRKFEHTIALSTLQRFLRGERRTGDRTVLRYAEFLSLAEPPEIDDDLGLGLVRFFTAKMPVQTTTDGFARVYRAYMKEMHLRIPLKARLYSRLHLTPNLQSSYFRVVSEEIPLPPIDPRRLGGIRVWRKGEKLPGTPYKELDKKRQQKITAMFRGRPPARMSGVFVPCTPSSGIIFLRDYVNAHLYVVAQKKSKLEITGKAERKVKAGKKGKSGTLIGTGYGFQLPADTYENRHPFAEHLEFFPRGEPFYSIVLKAEEQGDSK